MPSNKGGCHTSSIHKAILKIEGVIYSTSKRRQLPTMIHAFLCTEICTIIFI